MLVVALVNQKGGVGKTSTTVNTAAALAGCGRRVLVVDMDPQANATSALGVEEIGYDTADVLRSAEPGAVAAAGAVVAGRSPDWDGVSVVPARLDLSKLEDDRELGSEFRLRRALDSPLVSAAYDVVLIDSPPSVGRLTTNALVAASHVLVITEPTSPSLAGVVNLLDSIAAVTRYYNPALAVAGVLVNRMQNTREARLRLEELVAGVADLPIEVWLEQTIPHRAAITEALGAQAPPHALPGPGMREAAGYYDAVAGRLLAAAAGIDLTDQRTEVGR